MRLANAVDARRARRHAGRCCRCAGMATAEQFAAGALSSLAAELDRLGLPKIASFDSAAPASTAATPAHFGAAHEQMLCALYGVACVSASAAGSQAETTSDPDCSSPSARRLHAWLVLPAGGAAAAAAALRAAAGDGDAGAKTPPPPPPGAAAAPAAAAPATAAGVAGRGLEGGLVDADAVAHPAAVAGVQRLVGRVEQRRRRSRRGGGGGRRARRARRRRPPPPPTGARRKRAARRRRTTTSRRTALSTSPPRRSASSATRARRSRGSGGGRTRCAPARPSGR